MDEVRSESPRSHDRSRFLLLATYGGVNRIRRRLTRNQASVDA